MDTYDNRKSTQKVISLGGDLTSSWSSDTQSHKMSPEFHESIVEPASNPAIVKRKKKPRNLTKVKVFFSIVLHACMFGF